MSVPPGGSFYLDTLSDGMYKIPFSFLLIHTWAAALSEADVFQMLPPGRLDRMSRDSVIVVGSGSSCLPAGAEARAPS